VFSKKDRLGCSFSTPTDSGQTKVGYVWLLAFNRQHINKDWNRLKNSRWRSERQEWPAILMGSAQSGEPMVPKE
jgi:hypothetical protein